MLSYTLYPLLEELSKRFIGTGLKIPSVMAGLIFGIVEFLVYVFCVDKLTISFIAVRLSLILIHMAFSDITRENLLYGVFVHMAYNFILEVGDIHLAGVMMSIWITYGLAYSPLILDPYKNITSKDYFGKMEWYDIAGFVTLVTLFIIL